VRPISILANVGQWDRIAFGKLGLRKPEAVAQFSNAASHQSPLKASITDSPVFGIIGISRNCYRRFLLIEIAPSYRQNRTALPR